MMNGTQKRLRQAFDARLSISTRVFSALEVVCFYSSLAAFTGLAAQTFVDFSPTCKAVLNVLLAAAVGFLTNWLAIEMLFKPYKRQKYLLVWRQGLVPRNQAKVALAVGQKVATELIDPAQVAERLSSVITARLKSGDFRERLASRFSEFLRLYERQIAEALTPELVKSISQIVKRQATAGNFRELWNREIMPRLESQETRTFVAKKILAGVERRAPALTDAFQGWLYEHLRRFFERNVGFAIGGFGAGLGAEAIIAFIDWNSIEISLRNKLCERGTLEKVEKALEEYVDEFSRWINSDESQERVASWIDEFKDKIVDAVEMFVSSEFPRIINSLLNSPQLWKWIDSEFLPNVLPWLEKTIREQTPEVLQDLRVDELVAESIERQDAREFHQMIDDVAAEHLGAIQVLGFALGGSVGLLQQLLNVVVK